MQAVVLAAGKGSQFRPLSKNKLKILVEVDGIPLIQDIFDNLINVGASDILVDYKSEQIIDYFDDSYCDVPITYAHQREQLGLTHAIL